MVVSTSLLKEEYKDYKQPLHKIKRLIKDGKLFPIVKGLYETDRNVNPLFLAIRICRPSYISFESALSYYGMIPEAVYSITSATFKKKKTKEYHTLFGNYIYRDVCPKAYPYGIELKMYKDYTWHIATKEKALCDQVSKAYPITSMKAMEEYLFKYMRIYEDTLLDIELDDIRILSEKYKSKNVEYLYKYLRRYLNEKHTKTNDW